MPNDRLTHPPLTPATDTLLVGRGLLADPTALCQRLTGAIGPRAVVIMTDTQAGAFYADKLIELLQTVTKRPTFQPLLITVPPGESSKTRDVKADCEDQMLRAGLGRDTIMVALGGGVVTDLAGFVAATYCRGIPSIYFPTTLLGMVDAAIGGKTGVNTPLGKNMIGAFHPPTQIICDLEALCTLGVDEVSHGLVETAKHALIADRQFFDTLFSHLQAHGNALTTDNITAWQPLIEHSAAIKQTIVCTDAYEQNGKRQHLNFGHTIAHAIERHLDYTVSHGQAVAAGLWIEAHLSLQAGLLDETDLTCITELLDLIPYQKPLPISHKDIAPLIEHMRLDKKSQQGRPRFVLLCAIGHVHVHEGLHAHLVSDKKIEEALQLFIAAHHA